MRKSVFRRILALLMCIALPLQFIPATAETELSVSVSYTCSTPEPAVGSVLTFTLTGVGTVDYCVMIVEPDSMQTFLYGASSTYTISKPGLHIIIAYGTNNTDPTAPGFARCMSGQIWLEAGEGSVEEEPQTLWFFEPLTNALHIYSTPGEMGANLSNSRIVIAEGEDEPDLSTIRIVDEKFGRMTLGNPSNWCFELYAGYVDHLGLEIGKTYHIGVMDEGMDPEDVTEFVKITYDPGYIIFRPIESGWINLWGEDDLEIAWYPMEEADWYEISIVLTFYLGNGEQQTCEIPVDPMPADALWPDGMARLVIMKEAFLQLVPFELQLYNGTLTINIDAYGN